jgi:lipopolysaccharide exporter
MSPSVPLGLTKAILGQMNLVRIRQRGFFQNVMVVMTSTGLAQLLTIGFSPVLSRLYGPGDFGVYGTFLSVAGVLSAVVTLQYSEALMLPDQDREAAGLFWAAGLSAAAITLLFCLPWVLFPSWWHAWFDTQQLNGWLWVVPVAALVTGINETLTAWCARRKAFKRAATIQVARSVTANSGQTAAGVASWGAGGLIGGGLFGDILASIGLFFWVVREDGAVLRAGANRKQILAAAREHQAFALYSTPQNLMNAASQGAPVILLIHYFGTAIGGTYAFAIRVLQLPMSFILTSLRQVLFQKLSEVHNNGGDLRGLFTKTTSTLLGLALVPAAIGFVFAPQLFGLVFGSKWVPAGEYARWLLIWLVPGFCNLPAALVGRILRQQRNLLLFDMGLLGSRLAVLVLGGIYMTPLNTIVSFSIVGAAFNIFLILFIWRLLKLERPTPTHVAPKTDLGKP